MTMDIKSNLLKDIKSLREEIHLKEIELSNKILEVEKILLSELSEQKNISVGSYIESKQSKKRFIIEDLNLFFNQNTLDYYFLPTIKRLKSDGITPANVKDVDNYIFQRTPFTDISIETEIHHTSSIRIASGNNLEDFILVDSSLIEKKKSLVKMKIKKEKIYTNASGYSAFYFPDDKLIKTIVSHRSRPTNLSKELFDCNYFLEIVTIDNRYFIYTDTEFKNKSIRLTDKKINSIKDMIINDNGKLFEYSEKELTPPSFYHSYFHNYSLKNNYEFSIKFHNYLKTL